MAQYYQTHPSLIPVQMNTVDMENGAKAPMLSEFNKLCETLLTADAKEGWASELCHYLSTMQHEVMKTTDLIEWWQIRSSLGILYDIDYPL